MSTLTPRFAPAPEDPPMDRDAVIETLAVIIHEGDWAARAGEWRYSRAPEHEKRRSRMKAEAVLNTLLSSPEAFGLFREWALADTVEDAENELFRTRGSREVVREAFLAKGGFIYRRLVSKWGPAGGLR